MNLKEKEERIMANMSYCRFRNTRIDLADCLETLEYNEEISKEEYNACKRMFENIFDFFCQQGILDSDDEWFEEFENRFNDFVNCIQVED